MSELVGETCCIVLFAVIIHIFLNSIAVVRYSISAFEPARSLLCHFLGVDAYFHAKVEETVGLSEIHDVESDIKVLSRILYLEVEPLSVTVGIDVILHKQIILIF